MTHPLLQPDDRFRRESVVDPRGRNRFSDDAPPHAAPVPSGDSPLAPPVDASLPAYEPRYQISYPHRGPLVAWLGTLGFLLCWGLLLVFTEQGLIGLAAAMLGIALSLAAVVVGYGELAGMSAGAIDTAGRGSALLGYRLGVAGVVLGIGAFLCVVALIVRGIVEFG